MPEVQREKGDASPTYLGVIIWGITMLQENEYWLLPNLRADKPQKEHQSCEGVMWIIVSATSCAKGCVLQDWPAFTDKCRPLSRSEQA